MAGLALPGAVIAPDRTLDTVRLIVGIVLLVGGIGGIVLLVTRRRPPLSMA
jgi:hypothetical protein